MSETESNTDLRVKGRLMSASEIERTLVRLAHEIVEKSNGSEDLALVGIKRRGVPLARTAGQADLRPSRSVPSIPACSTSSFIATISPRRACARW